MAWLKQGFDAARSIARVRIKGRELGLKDFWGFVKLHDLRGQLPEGPFEEAASAGAPQVETGRKYRKAILEAGGSRPAMESFKAFRGREPSIDALLRHQGMA